MEAADKSPNVVYSLTGTISNKIFNYKDTVTKIDIEDKQTFGTGINECECRTSNFTDNKHQHIITGDLRIIKNKKLRELLVKGPNFREPRTIKWKKCLEELKIGIDECAEMIIKNIKCERNVLVPWKEKITKKAEEKIEDLKSKINVQHTNPTLKQNEVIMYLQELHKKFVIVPIDKAGNNIAIICKKIYVEKLLEEIGIIGEQSETYEKTNNKNKKDIIEDNVKYAEKLNIAVTDKDHDLPSMHWIPKMHKTPIGARYIIASKRCSTKSTASAVSKAFRLIAYQMKNFHDKSKFYTNYHKYWIVQNISPIIEKLEEINRKKNAKIISAFDFSTLYTNIPHQLLITSLNEIIDFVFKGGNNRFIIISVKQAFWGSRKRYKQYFTNKSLKATIKNLILNCYFTVGNVVMKQIIGIPMGIDPAPFWANLFLYRYESIYISELIKSDKIKAKKYHGTSRFIDDLCALNDGEEFKNSYKEIYPAELQLKVEHFGDHATFLDLDIKIENKTFVYKLYDKRDEFPFSIVRMPNMKSNIPSEIFYNTIKSEILRIARCTLKVNEFILRGKDIYQRMIKQGGEEQKVKTSILKFMNKHIDTFNKYGTEYKSIISDISKE